MRFRTAYGKTFAVLTRQMLYKHIVRLTGLSHKKIQTKQPGSNMQLTGLEPVPKYMDMNLNHARMPIPPQLPIKYGGKLKCS